MEVNEMLVTLFESDVQRNRIELFYNNFSFISVILKNTKMIPV